MKAAPIWLAERQKDTQPAPGFSRGYSATRSFVYEQIQDIINIHELSKLSGDDVGRHTTDRSQLRRQDVKWPRSGISPSGVVAPLVSNCHSTQTLRLAIRGTLKI